MIIVFLANLFSVAGQTETKFPSLLSLKIKQIPDHGNFTHLVGKNTNFIISSTIPFTGVIFQKLPQSQLEYQLESGKVVKMMSDQIAGFDFGNHSVVLNITFFESGELQGTWHFFPKLCARNRFISHSPADLITLNSYISRKAMFRASKKSKSICIWSATNSAPRVRYPARFSTQNLKLIVRPFQKPLLPLILHNHSWVKCAAGSQISFQNHEFDFPFVGAAEIRVPDYEHNFKFSKYLDTDNVTVFYRQPLDKVTLKKSRDMGLVFPHGLKLRLQIMIGGLLILSLVVALSIVFILEHSEDHSLPNVPLEQVNTGINGDTENILDHSQNPIPIQNLIQGPNPFSAQNPLHRTMILSPGQFPQFAYPSTPQYVPFFNGYSVPQGNVGYVVPVQPTSDAYFPEVA